MIKALFPGSFDPPTYGHLNVIERTAKLFSHLDVVIGINNKKNYLFTDEERVFMVKELTKHLSNVSVHINSGLTVEICEKLQTDIIIRGVRNTSDFSFEFDTSLLNKKLNKNIETLFLPTEPDLFVVKSGAAKEIALLGGDVSHMVPPVIEKMLKEKLVTIHGQE